MGKVFIPQEPMRKDETGHWVPKMQFTEALGYGELVVCLPPGNIALSPAPTMMRLRESLQHFCDDDYLVAVGSPSVLAAASAFCAFVNRGKFRLLVWSKEAKVYVPTMWDVNQTI